MEQVEFSNIVILNKTDLVNKEQQQDILERINILNPKVKVLKSCQSKIDVTEILNTKLYNAADMGINSVMASASRVKAGLNNLQKMCNLTRSAYVVCQSISAILL